MDRLGPPFDGLFRRLQSGQQLVEQISQMPAEFVLAILTDGYFLVFVSLSIVIDPQRIAEPVQKMGIIQHPAKHILGLEEIGCRDGHLGTQQVDGVLVDRDVLPSGHQIVQPRVLGPLVCADHNVGLFDSPQLAEVTELLTFLAVLAV